MESKRMHLDPEPQRQRPQEALRPRPLDDTMGAGEGIGLLNLRPPAPPQVIPPSTPYKALPRTDHDAEWKYNMRRSMQEVVPCLFLGPYRAACKTQLEELKQAGITHIVCVRHLVERSVIRPVHEDHFTYMVVEMGDDGTVALIPFCNRVIKFIDGCIQGGGKVLVHGNAGLNRSASLVVAYIMATYGVGLREALRFVQSRRFSAAPCAWFMHQLGEYEAIYQAMHDVPLPLPVEGETTRPPVLKRGFDQISGDHDDDYYPTENLDVDIDVDINNNQNDDDMMEL